MTGKSRKAEDGLPASVRVAAVQWKMRGVDSIEAFEDRISYWIAVAADNHADFVCLPELFTMEIASAQPRRLDPAEAMIMLASYTDRFCALMRALAMQHAINIIAGSHPVMSEDGALRNVCHVVLRDGAIRRQEKLHITPSERECWAIAGGTSAGAIETDCGPIGVMICYDSEFPELARHLVDEGALLLFVPFCTEDRRGYLRVRYCCQARAVENQCYVITAGVAGNLPRVANMDVHFAQSAILTPSDFAFARDGIAAETLPNEEAIAIADLSLKALATSRRSGSVRNLMDRRCDLYRLQWRQG